MTQRYSACKDSGIEWIGEIPEHWEVKKLKYISTIKVSSVDKHLFDDELPVTLCNYTNVYKNDFIIPAILESVGTCTEEEFRRFEINKGDVLITKDSETPDDIGVPALVTEEMENTVCGYHVAILKSYSDAILGPFLFRRLQTKYARSYFEINSLGITRYGLGKSAIEALFVFKPPLGEQSQIVEFLDRKTSLVDRLIAAKEGRIQLLKEQRTALINHAVTKGLDPNVKMKDSGIEWIGEIPEHWEVKKLKFLADITLGKMLTPDEKDGFVLKPYLRSINIQTENVDIIDVKEMWFSPDELQKLRLVKGDLLINEGGDVGRSALWNDEVDECYIQNSVNRVRFFQGNNKYYLFVSLMHHLTKYYDSLVNRVSIPHLTKEKLQEVKFIKPPNEEQQQIVTYLNAETQKIDSLVSLEQKKIDLLIEYRQALISEAVTGKIKVTKE